MSPWPKTVHELEAIQRQLATEIRQMWRPAGEVRSAAGFFICFPRGKEGMGAPGDPAWAAAAWIVGGRLAATAVVSGQAGAAYELGLLALREGPLLEAVVRRLPELPEVLLVNATAPSLSARLRPVYSAVPSRMGDVARQCVSGVVAGTRGRGRTCEFGAAKCCPRSCAVECRPVRVSALGFVVLCRPVPCRAVAIR